MPAFSASETVWNPKWVVAASSSVIGPCRFCQLSLLIRALAAETMRRDRRSENARTARSRNRPARIAPGSRRPRHPCGGYQAPRSALSPSPTHEGAPDRRAGADAQAALEIHPRRSVDRRDPADPSRHVRAHPDLGRSPRRLRPCPPRARPARSRRPRHRRRRARHVQ